MDLKMLTNVVSDKLIKLAEEIRTLDLSRIVEMETSIAEMQSVPEITKIDDTKWETNYGALYRIRTDEETAKTLWDAACSEKDQWKCEQDAWKEEQKRINAKATKLERHYQMSRLIGHYEGAACLYIGQGQRFANRMHEHFTNFKPAQFGMHLSMWAPESVREMPIYVDFWGYDDLRASNEALQALEDAMWTEAKPIFGRQGKR